MIQKYYRQSPKEHKNIPFTDSLDLPDKILLASIWILVLSLLSYIVLDYL